MCAMNNRHRRYGESEDVMPAISARSTFDLRAYLTRNMFDVDVGDRTEIDIVVAHIVGLLDQLTDIQFLGPRSMTHGPKTADDPAIGHQCIACSEPFVAGDLTMFISLGPGGNEAARAAARSGELFEAVAVEAHVVCVTGVQP